MTTARERLLDSPDLNRNVTPIEERTVAEPSLSRNEALSLASDTAWVERESPGYVGVSYHDRVWDGGEWQEDIGTERFCHPEEGIALEEAEAFKRQRISEYALRLMYGEFEAATEANVAGLPIEWRAIERVVGRALPSGDQEEMLVEAERLLREEYLSVRGVILKMPDRASRWVLDVCAAHELLDSEDFRVREWAFLALADMGMDTPVPAPEDATAR